VFSCRILHISVSSTIAMVTAVFRSIALFNIAAGEWFTGIDSVKVISPNDSFDWWGFYQEMRQAQFNDTRWAILLTSGNHSDAEIGVGYYTSIMGVGASRDDVVVKSFYSLDYSDDASDGGATNNFWRSVEGVTATNPSITWAASQACPIRRSVVNGELWLSETGSGTHWSSGGYISDVSVKGQVHCGTQQQFFFRNTEFEQGADCDHTSNVVFVGSQNEGEQIPHASTVDSTPQVAEKPFLVEEDGSWYIAVPFVKQNTNGVHSDTDVTRIAMEDVFVATAGNSAAFINTGMRGKKALLLTPGIYAVDQAIRVLQPGFVVLGIGFPTIVPSEGVSGLSVEADDVRVAMVLLEAGTKMSTSPTQPMLHWTGSHGVGSDVFSRTGAFPGRGCITTRADVHVQIDGDGTILDNTWFWHADHDDCTDDPTQGAYGDTHPYLSDQCYDQNGLLVNGDQVVVYGLKVEHTLGNLVQWNGEEGEVYFFQSELPYHNPGFGAAGFVGYRVADGVRKHSGVGLGVYIIFDEMTNVTAFRVPPEVNLTNILAWCITGPATQFADLVCVGSDCFTGNCDYNQCRLPSLPAQLVV